MSTSAEQTYYGSSEGMPENILTSRLEQAKKEVATLTAEMTRRSKFTDAERLADRLHRLLHNGVDCDFYYSNWPHATGCRADFRNLAENILNLDRNSPEYIADAVVALMERQKFGKF